MWPRVDRQRYNTPKRLVEQGMATARVEATGKRKRTVYSITPAGRRALKKWLGTESRPSALEFEGMVRVILAEQGSVEDLRANLRIMGDQACASHDLFRVHAEHIVLADGGTFPEREHLMALGNRFMIDHFTRIAEFADWALEQVESWPDTTTPAVTHRDRTRAILEESVALELGQ